MEREERHEEEKAGGKKKKKTKKKQAATPSHNFFSFVFKAFHRLPPSPTFHPPPLHSKMAFALASRSALVARPAAASSRRSAVARRVSVVRAEPENSTTPAVAETPAVVEVRFFCFVFFPLLFLKAFQAPASAVFDSRHVI